MAIEYKFAANLKPDDEFHVPDASRIDRVSDVLHDTIRPRPMLAGEIKTVVRVVACTGETHEFAPADVLHMHV